MWQKIVNKTAKQANDATKIEQNQKAKGNLFSVDLYSNETKYIDPLIEKVH